MMSLKNDLNLKFQKNDSPLWQDDLLLYYWILSTGFISHLFSGAHVGKRIEKVSQKHVGRLDKLSQSNEIFPPHLQLPNWKNNFYLIGFATRAPEQNIFVATGLISLV